jgi:hypothetical protein
MTKILTQRRGDAEKMKNVIKKISFLILCVSASLWLISCQKTGNSNSGSFSVLGLSDETQEAANLVEEANVELKKIRKMYRENQGKVEELKAAMNEAKQNPEKIDEVKKIADELVYIINDGLVMGKSAVEKIEKAEEMNINDQYKKYLALKRESLQKQLDAFEYRRQAAIFLRDIFGSKDKFAIEKARSEFRDREESFQKEMELAREMSGEANQLAKEAMNQSN